MARATPIAIVLLAAALMLSVFFPNDRSWGLHFLAYYPFLVQALLIGGAAILVGGSVLLGRSTKSELAVAGTAIWNRPGFAGDLIFVFGCGLFFAVFSARLPLLGDGQLWVNELSTGSPPAPWFHHAYLSLVLHSFLYGWLNDAVGLTVETTYRLTSVLAGMAAAWAWIHLGRAFQVGRVLSLLCGFAWGGVILYFGYIENYSLMAAALTWMLALMFSSVQNDRPSRWVFVLAGLAMFFHPIAVTFVPVILAYSWWAFDRSRFSATTAWRVAALIWTALVPVGLWLGWRGSLDTLLSPIRHPGGDPYTLFSFAHLVDLANGIALLAGPLVLLILALGSSRRVATPLDRKLGLFAALSLAFPFSIYVANNPHLGMPRDWDLGAAFLCAVPCVSIVLCSRTASAKANRQRLGLLLVSWILVVIVPWIGVQASVARGHARFESLLRLDPQRSASGWDYLSSYHHQLGHMEDWGRSLEEAAKSSDNPRYRSNLASFYLWMQRWDDARGAIDQVHASVYADSSVTEWERGVLSADPILPIGESYEKRGQLGDAYRTYAMAEYLDPTAVAPVVSIARLHVRTGRLPDAEGLYRKLAARRPDLLQEELDFYRGHTRDAARAVAGWLGVLVVARTAGDSSLATQAARSAWSNSKDKQRLAPLLPELGTAVTDSLR